MRDESHAASCAGLPPGVHDLALAELTPDQRALLDARDCAWFCSHAFCTLFFPRGAARVRLSVDAAGHLTRAIYYDEQPWLRRWTVLHLFGPVRLAREEILALLREHGAQAAVIDRMDAQDADTLRGPWHRVMVLRNGEDFRYDFPATVEAYLASLSPYMRKRLPYYERRLQREIGAAYGTVVLRGTEIDWATFWRLTEMNTARIAGKGLTPGWSQPLMEQRFRLAQQQGVLYGITRDGVLIGGALNYVHPSGAVLGMIAHDPAYNHLHVGYVSIWMAVRGLIAQGVRHYQSLWGVLHYKSEFGGRFTPLYSVTLFRHPLVAACWHLRHLPRRIRQSLRDRLSPELAARLRRWLRRRPAGEGGS